MFQLVGANLREGGIVVDIGPGIKPQTLIAADVLALVEPHDEYADFLREQGKTVHQTTALEFLDTMVYADTVTMLDVIEHMDKAEALEVIRLAKEKADQVVIFTPLGFLEQTYADGEPDAWGMNGGKWQTHRSGWMPDEFPGWITCVSPTFHGARGGAFFAVWGAK